MGFNGPHCGGCPHRSNTMSHASTRGEMRHGVVIVLEALGEQEAFQRVPAVGPTGSLLNRMVERTTDPESGKLFKRDEFLVTNTVWCRPYELIQGKAVNRTPTEDEVEWCMKRYLLPLLEREAPRAILASGAVAFRALTGRVEPLSKLRGYPVPMLGTGIPVVGTYHPAYLMKGKLGLVRVWQMDFLKTLYLSRNGKMPSVERSYLEDPSVPQFNLWVHDALRDLDAGAPLSFDIETPHAGMLKDEAIDPEDLRVEDDASYTILRIAFCTRPNEAVSIPWSPGYMDGIHALFAHPGRKIVWNRFFDVPRVEFNGVPINGTVVDGMDMWHFAEPALPMGLKYATTFVAPDMPPWMLEKDSRPAWYNAADTDTARRCVDWCEAKLRREGRLGIFERHFTELGKRLQKISLRGIPTSPEARKEKREKYEALFKARIEALQPLVPEEVKPVSAPYKSTEAKLREAGKWVEGRMVPVEVERVKTREDVPEEKRCDNKTCSAEWVREDEKGRRRCEKHLLKGMKETQR